MKEIKKMKGYIRNMIVHHIGNKSKGDGVGFSDHELEVEVIETDLLKLIAKSFKYDDLYHFYSESNLESNPVYTFTRNIFKNPLDFKNQSNHIAKTLYECSTQPNIKSGELSIIHIKDCEFEDEILDAIVLLKSENCQNALQLERTDNGFIIKKNTGVSLSKIDKGCIIYNTASNDGYKISVIDKLSKTNNSKYWTDMFLHIQSYKSAHHQTNSLLNIWSDFFKKSIANNSKISKVKKAMIAHRAKQILIDTKTESITLDEYISEVFQDISLSEKFISFIDDKNLINSLDSDSVLIDKKAVKKVKNIISKIKLDDNFELNIKGAEERVMKGYDSNAGLNYYKLYYDEEI